jgi:hypothetical protein
VWQVGAKDFAETAAFNAELYDGSSSQPLVMNAGDTIRILVQRLSCGNVSRDDPGEKVLEILRCGLGLRVCRGAPKIRCRPMVLLLR